MLANFPPDMDATIKEEAAPLMRALLANGWSLSQVTWDNTERRTVALNAKSPIGTPMFLVCGEVRLTAMLKALLES